MKDFYRQKAVDAGSYTSKQQVGRGKVTFL